MYFSDPDQGRRRRSLVRDQWRGAMHGLEEVLDEAGVDLRNRTRGFLAEIMGRVDGGEAPDWIVEERARAEMGRHVTHPGALSVSAAQGRLTVSGPILAGEVSPLLMALGRVRGVKGVDNALTVHQSAEGVPALQGAGRYRRPRPELMQENWSPSARLLTGAGGVAAMLYGLGRGGLVGTAASLAGLGLALRGITNMPLKRAAGMTGRRAVDVEKSINIDAPVEDVYQLWANFENFPRFMAHVKEVRNIGLGRSHWVVAGPVGVPVEWDAVITRLDPNRVIAWKSLPTSTVKSAGLVFFEPNGQGGTRVTVRMSYNPPAGALGHAVAALFGADPRQAMNEDLVRLKGLLETGKASAEGREIRREEVFDRT
jgi:uncharacterized membrane protein